MYEVAIFDGLTAEEVLSIYQGGLTVEETDMSYRESDDSWVSIDMPRSGSRYRNQLVVLSEQGQIYFGSF